MKPFIFSLERMRSYKTQLLNKEKSTLARLKKEKDELDRKIAALDVFRRKEYDSFIEKQQHGVTATDLSSHNFIMDNTRHQQEELARLLIKAKEAVATQLKVVIAISQELSGLDKLEEKQREEYRMEESHANELEIAETISSKLIRSRQAKQA